MACQNGCLDLVSFYVEEFKLNVNEKDFGGVTSLHFACINGNEKVVAYLLSNGANIIPDKNGFNFFFIIKHTIYFNFNFL